MRKLTLSLLCTLAVACGAASQKSTTADEAQTADTQACKDGNGAVKPADCAGLAKLALPDTTIAVAEPHDAGPFTPPGATSALTLPAFCRVAGTVSPAIAFEVWLPLAAAWNGKFQGVGNGGLAGTISYSAMATALVRDYAVASTDTGHKVTNPDGLWALGHPELIVDFAWRATHEMTAKGKAVTAAFYGRHARHSYFVGCSKGGQQALMEAQRFPEDYDGIVAGDPANYWTWHYLGGHLWPELPMIKDVTGAHYIGPGKLQALQDAVNAKCDSYDGVADGVLTDPRRCDFDPASMLCSGAETASCLTAKEIESLRAIYSGPGADIYPGILPGAETGWASWITGNLTFTSTPPYLNGTLPTHLTLGLPFFKYFVFDDPNWDYNTLNFTTDVWKTNHKQVCAYGHCRTMEQVINAEDPDLREFRGRGNKLVQYHGFSDPDISPLVSVNYFESVVEAMTPPGRGHHWGWKHHRDPLESVQEFYRLFMVPGMGHCSGGPGPTTFDALAALETWVEQGIAPGSIPAAHVASGKTTFTRPLCPYPEEAIYNGTGDTTLAASFHCGVR